MADWLVQCAATTLDSMAAVLTPRCCSHFAIRISPAVKGGVDPHTEELGTTAMHPRTMWVVLKRYLSNVPNALRERELPSGEKTVECVYTPHSLRATAATLLLDSGVDIMEVKELLGHRHVTTTQIYDKRRRAAREGASHKMPL
jgi:integrase